MEVWAQLGARSRPFRVRLSAGMARRKKWELMTLITWVKSARRRQEPKIVAQKNRLVLTIKYVCQLNIKLTVVFKVSGWNSLIYFFVFNLSFYLFRTDGKPRRAVSITSSMIRVWRPSCKKSSNGRLALTSEVLRSKNSWNVSLKSYAFKS